MITIYKSVHFFAPRQIGSYAFEMAGAANLKLAAPLPSVVSFADAEMRCITTILELIASRPYPYPDTIVYPMTPKLLVNCPPRLVFGYYDLFRKIQDKYPGVKFEVKESFTNQWCEEKADAILHREINR